MNPHSLQRLSLESALRRALERKEFALHYQPKYDLKPERSPRGGPAALAPRRGLKRPARAIHPHRRGNRPDRADRRLGAQEACAQAYHWHEQGLRGVRIAVNLSARQFRNQKLGRDIRRCLVESGLRSAPAGAGELTESMVMQDPEQAAAMLNELKSLA